MGENRVSVTARIIFLADSSVTIPFCRHRSGAIIGLKHMTSYEIAFLFPGQGSQAVGMGVALAASHQPAKQVFDEVNDALEIGRAHV